MPLSSDVAKRHALWTCIDGQRVRQGRPSAWMNGAETALPAGTKYVPLLACHALPHLHQLYAS